jgi:hypothetical protein
VLAATTAHATLRAAAALVVDGLAFPIEAVFSLKDVVASLKDVVASYERLKSPASVSGHKPM